MHPDSVQGAHRISRLVFFDLLHQCVCRSNSHSSAQHICVSCPPLFPVTPSLIDILSCLPQDIYDPDGYECLFPAMIRDWRKKFVNANQLGDMAFGFTQLAG